MRIDGVDHMLLERLQDSLRQNVQQTEQTDTDEKVRRQEAKFKDVPVPTRDEPWEEDVDEVIRKLNDTVNALDISLRFEKKEETEEDPENIRVVNTDEEEIIREIRPDEGLSMVAHVQTLIGVLLDERR